MVYMYTTALFISHAVISHLHCYQTGSPIIRRTKLVCKNSTKCSMLWEFADIEFCNIV